MYFDVTISVMSLRLLLLVSTLHCGTSVSVEPLTLQSVIPPIDPHSIIHHPWLAYRVDSGEISN
jgi:hypothetical protein